MSISNRLGLVGSHYLSSHQPLYRQTKKRWNITLNLSVGKPWYVDTLLRRTKHLLINYEKIGVIYEIRYPLSGNKSCSQYCSCDGAIRYAKTSDKPVLLHVLRKRVQVMHLRKRILPPITDWVSLIPRQERKPRATRSLPIQRYLEKRYCNVQRKISR